MNCEPLEPRRLLATFSFATASGNGADDITLGFDSAFARYEIRDTSTGDLLASRPAAATSDIAVIGNEESDTLRLAASFLGAPAPVAFNAGGGLDAIVASANADFTLSNTALLIGSLPAVTLQSLEQATLTGGPSNNVFDLLGFNPASGSVFADGGAGNDVYREGSSQLTVLFTDPSGNETYALGGSTITVIDDAGDDVIDLSQSEAGVSLTFDDQGGHGAGPASSFNLQGAFENVILTPFDDTVTTTSATLNQTISAGAGNDTINEAGDASYFLYGGAGNDTYNLQGSTVVAFDDQGDDTVDLSGADAGLSLAFDDDGGGGGGGDASFTFDGGFENVILTPFDDTVTTTSATLNQTISAGAGNDTINEAGDASYFLYGGAGNDTYNLQGSTVVAFDDQGDDTVDLSGADAGLSLALDDDGGGGGGGDASFTFDGGFENVILTPFDDTITTTSATLNQTISAGAGDDTINEAGGASYFLYGGAGNDTYSLQGSTVTAIDDSGDDTIDFSQRDIGVSLTLDDEGGEAVGSHFTFQGSFEKVVGSKGADKITSHTNSSRKLLGESGDDEYILGGEHDVDDAAGDDIYRTSGKAAIVDGDDRFLLDVSGFGGAVPTAECNVNGACIVITDSGVTAHSADGALDISVAGRLSEILGTNLDDLVTVQTSSGSATIATLGGNDRIDGLASSSNDIFDAGLGSDFMRGGTGDHIYRERPGGLDTIIDLGGIDTIDFSQATRGVKFSLAMGAGNAQIVDSAGNQVAVTGVLENAIGSAFNDVLTGNGGANYISGLGGADKLVGQDGRDLIIGGSGADSLTGSAAEDILIAGQTLYDVHDEALRAILVEWNAASSLEERVARLRSSSIVLADGTVVRLVKSLTVNDDAQIDKLTGSSGPDWLFFGGKDKVTDLNLAEDVVNNDDVP